MYLISATSIPGVGFFGIVASAVLVGICTGVLTMTRRERLIHNVLENDQKKKELKIKAAIVLQRIWRKYQAGQGILNRASATSLPKPVSSDGWHLPNSRDSSDDQGDFKNEVNTTIASKFTKAFSKKPSVVKQDLDKESRYEKTKKTYAQCTIKYFAA